jgi:hypothetical protein
MTQGLLSLKASLAQQCGAWFASRLTKSSLQSGSYGYHRLQLLENMYTVYADISPRREQDNMSAATLLFNPFLQAYSCFQAFTAAQERAHKRIFNLAMLDTAILCEIAQSFWTSLFSYATTHVCSVVHSMFCTSSTSLPGLHHRPCFPRHGLPSHPFHYNPPRHRKVYEGNIQPALVLAPNFKN